MQKNGKRPFDVKVASRSFANKTNRKSKKGPNKGKNWVRMNHPF